MGRIKSTVFTLARKRVSPVDPTDGQVHVWNAEADQWEPGTVSGGGGFSPTDITGADPILGADVADDDEFVVIDVDDLTMDPTGTTKKITREELPAALGLGKVTSTGLDGKPTLYDPASTNWDDGIWVCFDFNGGGDQNFAMGVGNSVHPTTFKTFLENDGAFREAGLALAYQVDGGGGVGGITFDSGANPDGSGGYATYVIVVPLNAGRYDWDVNATRARLLLRGVAGQTDPLLDIQDSNSNSILSVAPDGSIGGGTANEGDVLKFIGGKWVSGAP